MKANHNPIHAILFFPFAVSNGSKILKWKQITTEPSERYRKGGCFQWFKDTKMKANHNIRNVIIFFVFAVSNGSKILKWKQITTVLALRQAEARCFQWFKDTKMKANHNSNRLTLLHPRAVSNGSKILKWKQITTRATVVLLLIRCFQWFKDTKMKANHNFRWKNISFVIAVSNGSKILKWKQITTQSGWMNDRHSAVSNGSKILKWKQITTPTSTRFPHG